MRSILRFGFSVLFVSLVGSTSGSAAAADKVQVDVCREVVEKVFIPPTYKEMFSCPMDARCFFMPHCCVPVICAADPVCRISQLVVDVAGHWQENHEIVCQPEWRDPAEELKKWLQGQIPNIEDAVLPGARQVVSAEIELMRTQGQPIPDGVKAVVRELLKPYWDKNAAKFDAQDVDNVRIISNANALAKPYLQSGFDAITLSKVIVINDAAFKTLVAAFPSLQTMKANRQQYASQLEAALLVVHELVHAKQYRILGFSVFLDQYVFEAIRKGYASIPFEQEAYDFAQKVNDEQLALQPNTSSSSSSLTTSQANAEMRNCIRKRNAKGLGDIKLAAPLCWKEIEAKKKIVLPTPGTNLRFMKDVKNRVIELKATAPVERAPLKQFSSATSIKPQTAPSVAKPVQR